MIKCRNELLELVRNGLTKRLQPAECAYAQCSANPYATISSSEDFLDLFIPYGHLSDICL
jgi:hypothetical protein